MLDRIDRFWARKFNDPCYGCEYKIGSSEWQYPNMPFIVETCEDVLGNEPGKRRLELCAGGVAMSLVPEMLEAMQEEQFLRDLHKKPPKGEV